jgi:hypothetical protein
MPAISERQGRPIRLRKPVKKKVVYGPPAPKPRPAPKRKVYGPPAPNAITRSPVSLPRIGGIKVEAKPEKPKPKKTVLVAGPRGMSVHREEGRSTGEILGALARPAPRKRTIVVAGPRGMSVSRQKATPGGEMAVTAIRNVPKDVGELVITTPSSLYALAETAVKRPKDLPKELVKPYVDLVKDPVKAFSEHPVSTTLMVSPTIKVPARLGGRVAAATGKRSLATEPATFEGTSVKAQRWRSPDVTDRGRRRPKGATVTAKEIDQRVDEAFDAAQLHKQAAVSSAAKQANERFGALPKHERDAAIEEHLSGAVGGAQHEATRRFAREFGSHWQVHKGAVVKPKRPAENSGVLHADRADAERIAERVPWDAAVVKVEHVNGGDAYAVVPTRAAERWSHHGRGAHAHRDTAVPAHRAAALDQVVGRAGRRGRGAQRGHGRRADELGAGAQDPQPAARG